DTDLAGGTELANNVFVIATDAGDTDYTGTDADTLTVVEPYAGIQVQKTASHGYIQANRLESYTITVANIGDQPLSNVVVIDTIVGGLNYDFSDPAADTTGLTGTKGILRWDSGNVPIFALLLAGQSVEIQLTVRADTDVTASEVMSNTASVTGYDQQNDLISDTDTARITAIVPTRKINIEKSAVQGVAILGEEVTYILTITNNGNQTLTNVEIIDTFSRGLLFEEANYDPAKVTFLGATNDTATANTCVFQIDDPFEPGDIENIRLTFTIDEDPTQVDTPVVNLVTVTALDEAALPVMDNAAETLGLNIPQPSIKVEKTATDSVVPLGKTITYILTVINDGSQNLTSLTVVDTIPRGLYYRTSTYDDAVFTTFTATTATLTWEAPVGYEFVPGATQEIEAIFDIDKNPNNVGDTPTQTVMNEVTVSGYDQANDLQEDIDRLTLVLGIPQPTIDVQKVASESELIPGEVVTYTLTVTNVGGQEIRDLIIYEDVPQGLAFVSAQFNDNSLDFNDSPDNPIWTLDALNSDTVFMPGEKEEIRLTFAASENINDYANSDTVENTARATGYDQANVLQADTDTEVLPISLKRAAINIHKTGLSEKIYTGQKESYLITVTNIGNQALRNVTIYDTLPVGLTYDSSDPAGVNVGQVTTWALPDTFDVGEIYQVRLTVIADTGIFGAHVNIATVDCIDESYSHHFDSDTALIVAYHSYTGIQVQKVANARTITAGSEESYHITVTNIGSETLTGITLTDTVDVRLTFIDAKPAWTGITGDTVATWDIGALAPGRSYEIRLTVKADTDLTGADQLPNLVFVTSTDADGDIHTGTDSDTLTVVEPYAGIQVQKVANSRTISQGEEESYHITVTNIGNDTLTGITLTDQIDVRLNFIQAKPAWTGITGDTVSTWDIGTLASGQIYEIRLTVKADTDLTGGEELPNLVFVTSTDADGDIHTGTDSDTLTVVEPYAGIQVQKVANARTIQSGAEESYHITVTNIGSDTLTNITLTDTIDARLTFVDAKPVWTGSTGDTVRTWNIGTLASGVSYEIRLTVKADTDLISSTELPNQVFV
ncbi:DUF11 domain-containing protein, partial [bacterium]|nr:DUF11 domain-containing protein [bacterium]